MAVHALTLLAFTRAAPASNCTSAETFDLANNGTVELSLVD